MLWRQGGRGPDQDSPWEASFPHPELASSIRLACGSTPQRFQNAQNERGTMTGTGRGDHSTPAGRPEEVPAGAELRSWADLFCCSVAIGRLARSISSTLSGSWELILGSLINQHGCYACSQDVIIFSCFFKCESRETIVLYP